MLCKYIFIYTYSYRHVSIFLYSLLSTSLESQKGIEDVRPGLLFPRERGGDTSGSKPPCRWAELCSGLRDLLGSEYPNSRVLGTKHLSDYSIWDLTHHSFGSWTFRVGCHLVLSLCAEAHGTPTLERPNAGKWLIPGVSAGTCGVWARGPP